MSDNIVFVAFYPDWSDFRVFATEIDALRYAVGRPMSVRAVCLPFSREDVEKAPHPGRDS